MEQAVPKRRHIKFRCRGITQKKAYNIDQVSIDTLIVTFGKTLLSHSIRQNVFTKTTNAEIFPS
jgi:hypothetical protein